MSSIYRPHIQIWKAGAAIAKGQVVKFDTVDYQVVKSAASTDKLVGVCQNAPAALGDLAEVALQGGGAKGAAGGTIARGDLLTSDASGNLVATTSANDRIIGTAMQSAVSGDLFDMMVSLSNY